MLRCVSRLSSFNANVHMISQHLFAPFYVNSPRTNLLPTSVMRLVSRRSSCGCGTTVRSGACRAWTWTPANCSLSPMLNCTALSGAVPVSRTSCCVIHTVPVHTGTYLYTSIIMCVISCSSFSISACPFDKEYASLSNSFYLL